MLKQRFHTVLILMESRQMQGSVSLGILCMNIASFENDSIPVGLFALCDGKVEMSAFTGSLRC